MGGFSLTHILVLVVLALIFFRPQRIGAAAKGLGQFWRSLKNEMNTIDAEAKDLTPQKDLEKDQQKK
ncbi:MAG: Sec-independent protein translocase subunit TatA/TatB [Pseudobdellovibrionaceae bacterium]